MCLSLSLYRGEEVSIGVVETVLGMIFCKIHGRVCDI
jgi:hypothetical protein